MSLRIARSTGVVFALAGVSLGQGLSFVETTSHAALGIVGAGNGRISIGVGDYNGDGYQDVVLVANTEPRVFRNNYLRVAAGLSQRLFVDETEVWIPQGTEPASLALFGDLDNDGDQDLVVVKNHWNPAINDYDPDDTGITYMLNTGSAFVPGSSDPNLARAPRGDGGLALADMDVDGDLDIVYCHKGIPGLGGPHGPGYYIRNDGLPNLIDATAATGSGIDTPRKYLSVVLADFSGDLLTDIHCSVDVNSDYHAHNLGNGQFANVTTQVGATNAGSDMGLAVGDIENDGDFDIYSTNIAEGILYVNNGAGVFTEQAQARGVGAYANFSIGWGTNFIDLDHDGDQDLVFCGDGNPGYAFLNNGAGVFSNGNPGSGLAGKLFGFAFVPIDYDKDGDLDLMTATNVTSPVRLFRNDSPVLAGRHWIVVEPKGRADNRNGVGAKVQLRIGSQWQTRAIMAGGSFKSGPPLQAHFGLGASAVIDEIKVSWPSGRVQSLFNVGADTYLRIHEIP